MPSQDGWRRCSKCSELFFDGSSDKGRCPAGGGHVRVRDDRNFRLPHDVAETGQAQGAWRFCHKCDSMFYDGYPHKGVCSAGGGHEAAGFFFVLPHDIAGAGGQANWRFCHKCHVMFFDGAPNKGRCPAGGGHEAQGFNFVLPLRGVALD